MKNWLKVLLAVMLVLTCMFSYVACNNSSDKTDDDQNKNDNISGDGSDQPGNAGDIEELEEGYKVNFYYSYTAIVVNANDRTEEKNERKLVETVYIPYDNTGWAQKYLDTKDAISYNGYKFESWYPEWDETTQTGWNNKVKPQVAVGDPYAFDKPVTDDINLYAYKGVIAGDDIVWDIVYEYQTDAAIPPAEVDENSHLVTFVSIDKSVNITNKVSLLTLSVTAAEGWTEALIAQKDAIKYDGAAFTNWYTDWDLANMTYAGTEYTFTEAPASDIVLYGVIDTTGAGEELTAKTRVNATLSLVGSGAMYDFANRSVVDVPWYDHKDNITKVVMDDRITTIGQNAFAGFKVLSDFEFSDEIAKIGSFAFYETNSKFFKTLRLPTKVTELGANAFAHTALTQVYLNDGLKTIGERAFYSSNKIKYIVVPKSLSYIGGAAFHPGPGSYNGTPNAAHALAKVYYNGEEENLTRAADGNTVTFNGLTIEIENEWFNQIPAVYSFKADDGSITSAQAKSSWYTVEKDDLLYPAQYSYAVKYMIDGNLVPIAVDYVIIAPVLGDDGEPVLDGNGDPLFNGTVSEENINFMNTLRHKDGYGFYSFATGQSGFEQGTVISEDKSITCNRFVTENGVSKGYLGGGITWTLDSAGKLTVKPGTEPGDTNIAWDLTNSTAAATLWTGKVAGAATIKSIVVEEGVKFLGSYVFNATAITEITLPASLAGVAAEGEKLGIASNAFDNCTYLHSVYFAGTNLDDCISLKEMKLKDAKVYAKATDASYGAVGSYWIKDNDITTAWSIDAEGNLYVGGDSIMQDYIIPADAPWYKAKEMIKSVTIASNITDLADNLVYGYKGVTAVKLHQKVKYVPASALAGTGIVNNLNAYKNGMLIIDGVLVKVDPSRKNNEFFATNTSISIIAEGAFSRCNNIKTMFIANTVQYINAGAFDDANSIDRMYIDMTDSSWKATSTDFAYAASKIQLHYSGQWRLQQGQYVARECNHVYPEVPNEVVDSTCCVAGKEVYYCVFGDRCIRSDYAEGAQEQIKPKELNKDAHVWVEMTEGDCYKAPTHEEDGYQKYICTNTYEVKDEEGNVSTENCPEIKTVVLENVWSEYVPNADGTTETRTCKCHLCKDSDTPETQTRDIVTE